MNTRNEGEQMCVNLSWLYDNEMCFIYHSPLPFHDQRLNCFDVALSCHECRKLSLRRHIKARSRIQKLVGGCEEKGKGRPLERDSRGLAIMHGAMDWNNKISNCHFIHDLWALCRNGGRDRLAFYFCPDLEARQHIPGRKWCLLIHPTEWRRNGNMEID